MLFQVWYIIAFETQFEKYRKYRNITKSEQEIFLKKKPKKIQSFQIHEST